MQTKSSDQSILKKAFQVIVVTAVCGTFVFGHVFLCIMMLVTMVNMMLLPIFVCYLLWFIFWDYERSSKGGRRWNAIRELSSWAYYRDYFPVRLIKTAQLSPRKNYIFGYHPHGIMCAGAWCNFCTESTGFSNLFPGLKPHLLTLKLLYKFPIFRDVLMTFGLCDVSRESMQHILCKQGQGNVAIVVVGGAAESLDAHPGYYKLTLKNRKGFIKMAIRTGASLVPVISFGENDLFNQPRNPPDSTLRKYQNILQKIFAYAPIPFFGRLFVLPHQREINTIVGAPIDVKKERTPNYRHVNRIHKKYVAALSKLFHQHKTQHGVHKSTPLLIS